MIDVAAFDSAAAGSQCQCSAQAGADGWSQATSSHKPLAAQASSARHARAGQGGMQTLGGQIMEPLVATSDDGPHTVPFAQSALLVQAG